MWGGACKYVHSADGAAAPAPKAKAYAMAKAKVDPPAGAAVRKRRPTFADDGDDSSPSLMTPQKVVM